MIKNILNFLDYVLFLGLFYIIYLGLKHADQIIVFENGKIVQQGQHIDLIEVTGYYKELYEIQQANSTK